VGVVLHLMVTAIGVLFGQPPLWQIGLFWSEQWWWALVPEHAQPWGFAVEQGAVYGALAGLVAASQAASSRRGASPSPATVTTLAAFLLSGWDSIAHTQHQLVMAVLGAAVGRWTTLVLRGRR
jgi:hypothetical protein